MQPVLRCNNVLTSPFGVCSQGQSLCLVLVQRLRGLCGRRGAPGDLGPPAGRRVARAPVSAGRRRAPEPAPRCSPRGFFRYGSALEIALRSAISEFAARFSAAVCYTPSFCHISSVYISCTRCMTILSPFISFRLTSLPLRTLAAVCAPAAAPRIGAGTPKRNAKLAALEEGTSPGSTLSSAFTPCERHPTEPHPLECISNATDPQHQFSPGASTRPTAQPCCPS